MVSNEPWYSLSYKIVDTRRLDDSLDGFYVVCDGLSAIEAVTEMVHYNSDCHDPSRYGIISSNITSEWILYLVIKMMMSTEDQNNEKGGWKY